MDARNRDGETNKTPDMVIIKIRDKETKKIPDGAIKKIWDGEMNSKDRELASSEEILPIFGVTT
jgi:hypothetical protein